MRPRVAAKAQCRGSGGSYGTTWEVPLRAECSVAGSILLPRTPLSLACASPPPMWPERTDPLGGRVSVAAARWYRALPVTTNGFCPTSTVSGAVVPAGRLCTFLAGPECNSLPPLSGFRMGPRSIPLCDRRSGPAVQRVRLPEVPASSGYPMFSLSVRLPTISVSVPVSYLSVTGAPRELQPFHWFTI